MSALFDAVRHISAADAAERAGIPLVRRGGNYWCCCPIHREKTPSLKFYGDDGGFYCFGCHKGGDAVKLYSYLYNMEAVEAAQTLAHAFGVPIPDDTRPAGPPPPPKPTALDIERAAKAFFNQHTSAIAKELHRARAIIERLHAIDAAHWDNPVFTDALRKLSAAQDQLDAVAGYRTVDIIELYRERK